MRTSNVDPFHAIADLNRRRILDLLTREKMSINAVAENFDMSRPAVSKHIKILTAAGYISIENTGRERYCMLNPDGFKELKAWINTYDQFWNRKMKSLGKFLDKKSRRMKGK